MARVLIDDRRRPIDDDGVSILPSRRRRKGEITLSVAFPVCVECTQKVYQVGAEKSRLSFYSIPNNGINRVFFIPKPLTE
jgi:hypothetical protein